MKIEKLRIPPKNRYGLTLYCSQCKNTVTKNSKCNHNEKHKYKVSIHISGTKNGRTTKVLEEKNYDDALKRAIEIKKQVKNNEQILVHTAKTIINPNSIVLGEALFSYINYLNNIDIPHQDRKTRTPAYIKEVTKSLKDFIRVLNTEGIDGKTFPCVEVNRYHAGYYCKWLEENYSPKRYNNNIGILKSAFKHIIEYRGIRMANPFSGTQKKDVETENITIIQDEFERVLSFIDYGNPIKVLGGKRKEKKNMYRSYLRDAIELAVFTGLRREEWATLTWNDIKINPNGEAIIVTDNLKVERQTQKKYKKKYVPINPDLGELLNRLGRQDYKNTDLYILYPHRTEKLKTIMDSVSKGFSHYYNQAYPDRPIKQQKSLRKTYLTSLYNTVGDDLTEFSSYSDISVVENHYLNKRLTTKVINKDFWEK